MMSLSIIEFLKNKFLEFFGKKPNLIVSAPGRIDFLNTHQDYKGLPVVSVGINLRTYVAVSYSSTQSDIISLNLMKESREYRDIFSAKNISLKQDRKWFGNYLRATIMSLKKHGYSIGDVNALIYSKVPIGSGLASSAALLVSFTKAVSQLYGYNLSKKEIAELSYYAERYILNIPCGRLDQYGSAFGRIVKIETKPPYSVEELPVIDGVFVVLDSGIRHSTADIHPRRQQEINEGLRMLLRMNGLDPQIRIFLSDSYDKTQWDKIDYYLIRKYLGRSPERLRKRIEFTFLMHLSTLYAIRILRGELPSADELAELFGTEWIPSIRNAYSSSHKIMSLIGLIMNYQHILLRDFYDVSLPIIENIREATLSAGALGTKLSGAGLGGSLVSLTINNKDANNVLQAGLENGAKNGWIVNIDQGVKTEYIFT